MYLLGVFEVLPLDTLQYYRKWCNVWRKGLHDISDATSFNTGCFFLFSFIFLNCWLSNLANNLGFDGGCLLFKTQSHHKRPTFSEREREMLSLSWSFPNGFYRFSLFSLNSCHCYSPFQIVDMVYNSHQIGIEPEVENFFSPSRFWATTTITILFGCKHWPGWWISFTILWFLLVSRPPIPADPPTIKASLVPTTTTPTPTIFKKDSRYEIWLRIKGEEDQQNQDNALVQEAWQHQVFPKQ